jgi:hypothetical protein
MAIRGRKPTPTHLKIVKGNPGKRALPKDEVQTGGDLVKPKYLKAKRVSELWAEIASSCWWLGDADSYKVGMWCSLQAEFEKGPAKMVAARITQLRALGSELGLDPASRSRLGSMKGNRRGEGTEDEAKDPADKYF